MPGSTSPGFSQSVFVVLINEILRTSEYSPENIFFPIFQKEQKNIFMRTFTLDYTSETRRHHDTGKYFQLTYFSP